MAPDNRTLFEKKRSFCSTCLTDAANSNALEVAQDELTNSKAYREACMAKVQETTRLFRIKESAVSRCRINNRRHITRNPMTV
ncbi:hypothetical protein PHMEG_00033106 [Phytophthora megakarya]|uniref:Uncharacterized protein n=1 Tax=Phytophthora megakarya TaxID=4795 RepID=A0A225UU93_9STRA|nr:hypothetical protein PHMEG_00033106 [Phytophthora megakarya]